MAATIAALATTAVPAHAVNDYTPDGGPELNLVSTDLVLTDVQAGQAISCDHFDWLGDITNAGVSRGFGADGAELDGLVTSGCTNPVFGPMFIQQTGTVEMTITGSEVGSVSPAALSDVTASADWASCDFNIAGAIAGTFDDTSQVFTSTGSTLIIADTPTGFLCGILGVAQGQDITVSGSWTNVPPAGSTPLTITNP